MLCFLIMKNAHSFSVYLVVHEFLLLAVIIVPRSLGCVSGELLSFGLKDPGCESLNSTVSALSCISELDCLFYKLTLPASPVSGQLTESIYHWFLMHFGLRRMWLIIGILLSIDFPILIISEEKKIKIKLSLNDIFFSPALLCLFKLKLFLPKIST